MNYIDNMKIRNYSIKFIEKCPIFSNCNFKNVIPKNICPILLHTFVPYYITYMKGGNFSWVKKIGHVDIRCPNPEGNVIVDLINNNNKIDFLVTSSTNECCLKYKPNQRVDISKIFNKICPLVFDISFPWIQLGIKNQIKLRCPGCDIHKGIEFMLCGDKIENK